VIDDPKIFVQPPAGQTAANLYRVKKKPQQMTKRSQMMRGRTTKKPGTTQRSAASSRIKTSR
jgi:hypothetical protein